MGRPPLPLGTHGKIRCYGEGKTWYARTKFRDYDGAVRSVQRAGTSKADSTHNLKIAIRDRIAMDATATINPESKFSLIAEQWFLEYEEKSKSPNTVRAYRERLDNQILPALGELRALEVATGVCERFIRAVTKDSGANVAKMTKSVLSNVCKYAVVHGALKTNPVRDTSAVSVERSSGAPQGLTAEQTRQLRAFITYDRRAAMRDIVDVIDFGVGTGLRIGEILAVRDEVIHYNEDAGEVWIVVDATVIRRAGVGLELKKRPKTKAGHRSVLLPAWAAAMVLRRQADKSLDRGELGLLFPNTLGGLRDPSNATHDIKDALTFAGRPDVTMHWFRKTVVTLMDDAGISARKAADQLGHEKPSFTQDTYYARKLNRTGADIVLAALGFGEM